MSEKDKRQALRKQADYVVEFYDSEGFMLKGVGRLLDLSPTGALIESNLRLKPGEVVVIRMRRGGQSQLSLPATVVRVRGKGTALTYGVKFNRS